MSNVFADTSDSDASRPNPPTPAPAPRPQDPFTMIETARNILGAVPGESLTRAAERVMLQARILRTTIAERDAALNASQSLVARVRSAIGARPGTAIAERDAAREANATTPAPTAAPEPPPAPASDPIEIMRAELGHKGYWVQVRAEMLERAYRVTGGDASRAVDLLLLILR